MHTHTAVAWMDFSSLAGIEPFNEGNTTQENTRLADFANLQRQGANGNFLSPTTCKV